MTDGDYVLGTRDDEVDRLGLQHRVWRPRMLDAWRRGGINIGQTLLDVGAGPGFATLDLAEIAGPEGKVIALERSRHFLGALRARAAQAGLANIEAREQDVSDGDFGSAFADASWCRWLLSFVADPRRTVAGIARALKPKGVAIFHEYGDYGAWRMMPPNKEVDRFRALVMQSWRDAGGEPDIAPRLPAWLAEEGLEIVEIRPLIDIVRRGNFVWQWPAAFMANGAKRLHELGYVDAAEAESMAVAMEADPDAWMVTPLVVEIIARRP
jgi:SAM-dependent methyltransferase